LVWYGIVVLDDMTLLNIDLNCSKAKRRVSGGWGGWVGGGGVQSHFRVKPNLH